jgi:diguanylate cyclase (GGDEF)-like protein/PAS domain S-box-containing protein
LDEFDFFEDDADAMEAASLTRKTLVDTQNHLGAMLDVMPMGLLIHTEQAIIFANQEACRLLHQSHAGAVGHHVLDFIRPADVPAASAVLTRAFTSVGATLEAELVLERADASQRLIKVITGRLPWDGNPVIQILLQDITDQKRAETSLRQMTITDELTGAYNRRQVLYEAALYIEGPAAGAIPISVVLIDIDHFKRVNDTYGHLTGDVVLKQLARVAHDFTPTIAGTDSAIFARIGGEEFVVLLPGIEAPAAMVIADNLRRQIEEMRVDTPPHSFKVTASMGVAAFREADQNFEGLLGRADAALYEAKEGGRNRVVLAR